MNPRFGRGRGGPGGPGGPGGQQHAKYLAEALGIPVEKLQAAQETARQKMMAQAGAGGSMPQELGPAIP